MNFDNLHQILRSLYEQMMPLCGDMAGVAKGIAGLGALFYVAYRVWQSLARAEPIDVFPMLRPFAIGLCIMFFPTVVLGTINSIMSPVVQGTAKMLEAETLDMNRYREQKDKLEYEAMMRNPETAYLVSNEEFDKQLEELGWSPGDMVTMAGMYIERGMYNMKKGIRDFFREILELMFQAAALVIDTIRTFFLVVLAILGPIAFAISVWDGFQSTLTQWICRYIQVYLWLPVSDMFSTILAKIQVLMLQSDIERTMEFKSLKNIESSFRQIRLFGIVFLSLCAVITVWSVWSSYRFAERQREKIYVLDNGKSLMLALSQDLSQNRPAEAREHVRRFHELFFTLSPEKSAIEHNVKRALLLADKSVYNYYSDFAEKGYYNRIIAGNINQVLKVDSVVCDFNGYPYRAVTYATQKIIRQSNVTERSLVTTCRLLNSSRSDDNPNGFTIEGFTIIENKDLQTIKR